jgi:O-antigen/teichoic acid export membrane protein
VSQVHATSPVAALLGRGSAYAAGVVVQIAVAGLALPVVTRLVRPEAFGLIATALIVTNLLAVTVDLGLSRAVMRRYFRGAAGPCEARRLLTLTVLVTVAVTVVIDVAGPAWSRIFADVPYGTELRVAVWGAAAVAVRNGAQSILRAEDRTGWYLAMMMLSTAGAQVLGVVLLWSSGGVPAAYLGGLAAGAAVAALVGLVVSRATPALARHDVAGWGLRFAGPVLVAEASAVAIWFGDRVIIERLLGLEAVGRYQIAYTLGAVTLMITMAISQAWAPLIHAAAPGDRGRFTAQSRRGLLQVVGYAAVALGLASPLGLVILAPSSYEPTNLVPVVAVVAAAALPLVAQQAATHLIADAERTSLLASRGLLAVVLNLSLNVVLVPVVGLLGAAVATLLTYVGYAVLVTRAASAIAGAESPLMRSTWISVGVGVVAGALLPTGGLWLGLRLFAAVAVGVLLLRAGRRLMAATDAADVEPAGSPA